VSIFIALGDLTAAHARVLGTGGRGYRKSPASIEAGLFCSYLRSAELLFQLVAEGALLVDIVRMCGRHRFDIAPCGVAAQAIF